MRGSPTGRATRGSRKKNPGGEDGSQKKKGSTVRNETMFFGSRARALIMAKHRTEEKQTTMSGIYETVKLINGQTPPTPMTRSTKDEGDDVLRFVNPKGLRPKGFGFKKKN